MASILFVCLGNICRSPAAEGICRELAHSDYSAEELKVASCGLGNWHVGQLPDVRMRAAARERGVILTSRAQQFRDLFFNEYDYILAADHTVLEELRSLAKSSSHSEKIKLITAFSPSYLNEEIPDPYYGNQADFDQVLDICEDACRGLLEHIFNE